MKAALFLRLAAVASIVCGGLAGCDRLFDKGSKEAVVKADKKSAAGDFQGAINDYEAALDGTERSANIHYKLALIYDAKLKNPHDAAHHLGRYLQLAPNGSHAREAKTLLKQAEQQIALTDLKGAPVTQEEAVRLRNENLKLNKSLAELRVQKNATPVPGSGSRTAEAGQKPIPAGARTHVVQAGETLGTIAKKYYKNKARWKEIQDANFYATTGTAKIKAGQILSIP